MLLQSRVTWAGGAFPAKEGGFSMCPMQGTARSRAPSCSPSAFPLLARLPCKGGCD